MERTKHAKVVENVLSRKGFATSTLLTRQKGKPSASRKGVLKNQRNLYQWLNSNKFTNIDVELEGDVNFIFGLLCWDYWSMTCKYSTNKFFEVHNLLHDLFFEFAWVAEPKTKMDLKLECLEYKIDGCFKHRDCPWIFIFGESKI
jgi:hypothetical protein